jgi:hypothetical protein
MNVWVGRDSSNSEDDELRPEYDLKSLRVRRLGPGRKRFGNVINLEPDATETLPDVDSVKEESEP